MLVVRISCEINKQGLYTDIIRLDMRQSVWSGLLPFFLGGGGEGESGQYSFNVSHGQNARGNLASIGIAILL